MSTKTNPNGLIVVALWVRFGVPLGLGQTPALIQIPKNKKKNRTGVPVLCVLRAFNQCRCLPKAELNTKTNPNGHHSVAVWVRFGVQLDYSCRLKSVPSDGKNRVRRRMVKLLVFNSALSRGSQCTLPLTRFSPSDDTLFNRHE